MSVYENMGKNLRALCRQKGTISQVCKEIGINRQQFTKYLNGENFPRRATLEKICNYFGVAEIDLFKDPNHVGSGKLSPGELVASNKRYREVYDGLTAPQEMPLKDGLYYTYFQAHSQKNWIVRSVTAVKKMGNLTEFIRITGFNEKSSSPWSLYKGDHSGLVFHRRRYLYFVGLDAIASNTPSLIAVQWGAMEVEVLKGYALVWTTEGPEICNCLVERISPDYGLKRAIRESGSMGIKDAKLPTHIKQIFHNFDIL